MTDRDEFSYLNEKIILVSNRSPYIIHQNGNFRKIKCALGGVSGTLKGILKKVHGTWIAWNGGNAVWPIRMTIREQSSEYQLRLVHLSKTEIKEYYYGFANQLLWPLCHSFPEKCIISPSYWYAYQSANQLFAKHVLFEYRPGKIVWIHDFHLSLLPKYLRQKIPSLPIKFFWHIPFPAGDIFRNNPWATEILHGLLEADLIGFHTPEYVRNFLDCVSKLPNCFIDRDGESIYCNGRLVKVRAFPLGIDVADFETRAASPATLSLARKIRKKIKASTILISVDRIDYTKGIIERLNALRMLYRKYPEYIGRISLVQIVVPNRNQIAEYNQLRHVILNEVHHINMEFATNGWAPIHQVVKHIDRSKLVAYYRASDIALITPIRDGMNLIVKEYLATRLEETGAVVLSRYAGAAAEFKDEAIVVNPNRPEAIVDGIRNALVVDENKDRIRMRKMRSKIKSRDLSWWTRQILRENQPNSASFSTDELQDFKAVNQCI